jgi:hypothetical protein
MKKKKYFGVIGGAGKYAEKLELARIGSIIDDIITDESSSDFISEYIADFKKLSFIFETFGNMSTSLSSESNNTIFTIHHAAKSGDIAAIDRLITEGVDINKKDEEGLTPLHIAVENDQIETIKLLIRKGANVNERDENGLTPLLKRIGGLSNLNYIVFDTIILLSSYGTIIDNKTKEMASNLMLKIAVFGSEDDKTKEATEKYMQIDFAKYLEGLSLEYRNRKTAHIQAEKLYDILLQLVQWKDKDGQSLPCELTLLIVVNLEIDKLHPKTLYNLIDSAYEFYNKVLNLRKSEANVITENKTELPSTKLKHIMLQKEQIELNKAFSKGV